MSDQKLALGHAFTLHDLFMNFPVKKLKMTPEQCKEIYSDGSKRDLAASIFARSLEIVVNDIIDNNTHFKLPTLGHASSYIYMRRTEDAQFKRAFRRGKWNDVDFVMSNFCGYQLAFKIDNPQGNSKHKAIFVGSDLKQKITDNTNKGKQY